MQPCCSVARARGWQCEVSHSSYDVYSFEREYVENFVKSLSRMVITFFSPVHLLWHELMLCLPSDFLSKPMEPSIIVVVTPLVTNE